MENNNKVAVILAAGLGSRLGNITKNIPKCLLEINEQSIIERQIEILKNNNISNIIVVVGFKKNMIIERLNNQVEFVINDEYDSTNSSYSLWCARDYLKNGWIHLNCDLLFEEEILQRMINHAHSSIVIDQKINEGDDQEKVIIENNRIINLSKTLLNKNCNGKTIGMAQFDRNASVKILNHLENVINVEHEKNRWFFL